MNKRVCLIALVIVLGCVAFAVIQVTRRPPDLDLGGTAPHVIIYLVDTLRADHLGAYGYDRDTSPAFDAFGKEGILFHKPYAQTSWTKPSVATLFTGLLPSRHGAMRREQRLRPDVPTLAEVLKKQGYATASFISNPNVLPVFGFGRGFDVVRDVESIQRTARAKQVHTETLLYLEQNRRAGHDGPLFLYIHTRDPHAPYEPPSPYDRRFGPRNPSTGADPKWIANQRAVALYDGEIAYNDAEFGKLLEQFKRYGIYDNALIIFLSDHGEEFLDHHGDGHGKTLFEEQTFVPLMMKMPNGQLAGLEIDEPVRIVDLLPTICSLLDITPPPGIDGISFLPLLTDRNRESYSPILFAELNHDEHLIGSLISGDYKVIRRRLPDQFRRTLLFNIAQDPREKNNVLGTQTDIVEELLGSLDLIESTLGSGLYVEMVNGSSLDAQHEMSGTIETIGGQFDQVSRIEVEDQDTIEISEDKTRITFSVTMKNTSNPIHQFPPVLIDVDQIRFMLSPATAKFRVYVEVDGKPIDGQHLVLGDVPLAKDQPFESSVDDRRIQLASRGLVRHSGRPDGRPYCRIFNIAHLQIEEAHIDEQLMDRLRALGYVE